VQRVAAHRDSHVVSHVSAPSYICSVLQCVMVCCSVLQCVAVYYNVLQCVVVSCSVLQQCVAMLRIALRGTLCAFSNFPIGGGGIWGGY